MVFVARFFYYLSLLVMAVLFVWGGNKGFNRADGIPLVAGIAFFFLSRWGKTPWFPDVLRYSKNVILGAVALVFVPLALGHILKHWSLQTHGLDVAFIYSGLFYPFEWPPLWCTVCPNPTYFSEHFSPSLFLIAPFTALFKMNEVVMVLQSLLAAFIVLAFLYFGPIRNNKSLWMLALLFMVAHRTFRDSMLFDFREDMMAWVGFSLSLLAFQRERYVWAFIAFVVGMGAKENMCFLAPFMAVPILMDTSFQMSRKHRILWAGAYTLAGLVWMLITFKFAIPYFAQGQAEKHVLMSRLPIPGLESSSATSLVGAILEHPGSVFKYIVSQFADSSRYKYLLFMLLPTLPFTWRAWPWLIPALAGIGMNFISANETQRMMIFHYDLMVLPFLFFAFLKGMEKTPLTYFNKYAPYMVLWALMLFGRPPVHYIGKYAGEAWNHFQDHAFLSGLVSGPVTAANMEGMAQIVHLKETRVLYLPPEPCILGDETFYDTFLAYNHSGAVRSSLPFRDVRRFVLDSKVSGEACLATILRSRFAGQITEIISPSARFQVITVQ